MFFRTVGISMTANLDNHRMVNGQELEEHLQFGH